MKDLKDKLSKQKKSIEASLSQPAPMLCIGEKELPNIKKWKVGGTYTIKAVVRQTGMHEDRERGLRADLEIESIEVDQSDD